MRIYIVIKKIGSVNVLSNKHAEFDFAGFKPGILLINHRMWWMDHQHVRSWADELNFGLLNRLDWLTCLSRLSSLREGEKMGASGGTVGLKMTSRSSAVNYTGSLKRNLRWWIMQLHPRCFLWICTSSVWKEYTFKDDTIQSADFGLRSRYFRGPYFAKNELLSAEFFRKLHGWSDQIPFVIR